MAREGLRPSPTPRPQPQAAPPPAPAPAPAAAPPRAPRFRPRDVHRAAFAVALAALVLMASLGAASLLGEPRNSMHEPGERGLRQFADLLRAEGYRVDGLGAGPHALDAAEDPAKTLFLVAGVERSYSPGEVGAIVAFVERGGSALVADDFGFGDSVGRVFGVNFDERVLRDAAFQGNLSLVRVNATAGGRNFTVTANVPSSLGFGPQVQPSVIAESGLDSFIDVNLNGVEDPDDTKGPFPILASLPHGRGRALFASDPGLFMNGVFEDNRAFLLAFVKGLLPEGGSVVVDESRHPVGFLGAVVGALLAGEVQATSEGPVAAALGASGVLLAALLYGGFRGPEDITLHHSRLREPVHEATDAVTRQRLQRLAARVIADANNLGLDAQAAATPAQLAAMSRDPVLAALVKGEPTRLGPEEAFERLRAYAAQRAKKEAKR